MGGAIGIYFIAFARLPDWSTVHFYATFTSSISTSTQIPVSIATKASSLRTTKTTAFSISGKHRSQAFTSLSSAIPHSDSLSRDHSPLLTYAFILTGSLTQREPSQALSLRENPHILTLSLASITSHHHQ